MQGESAHGRQGEITPAKIDGLVETLLKLSAILDVGL